MSAQVDLYKQWFNTYFDSAEFRQQVDQSVKHVGEKVKRIFFIGNGGSNSICSHMMEDFAKIAGIPTFCFSDPALITCFANDYGYEKAMEEWLKIYFTEGDMLVAISSSGESKNILNAVNFVKGRNGDIMTLSGFKAGNQLSGLGNINFHVAVSNYGIVECFHQVILHMILDSLDKKQPTK